MRYEIKELSIGGILDQAVTLVRNHFKLLLGIALVLMIPLGVLSAVLTTMATGQQGGFGQPQVQATPSPAAVIAMMLVNLVYAFVAMPLTNAAVLHGLASEYLERPATVGQCFRRALQVFFPYLVTWILMGLVIGVGLLLLIIPGILFAFWYCLSTQIVVIEGTYGPTAMRRSHQLMKGNYGTVIVMGILFLIIQGGLGVVQVLVPNQMIGAAVGTIVQSLVFLFVSAAWVVFYFSCRCKLENFDLALLAEAVGRDDPDAQLNPTG